MIKIIEQKLITDQLDIVDAGIIDFNRLNGCFEKGGDAIRTIFSYFDNAAVITTVDILDFHDAPDRDDWGGWDHAGNHEEIGKLYWNWFFWKHPDGELNFSDSPDFYGVIPSKDGAPLGMFWGDVGKVSASAFAMTQKGMSRNDIWVSLQRDGSRHVIIEPQVDINNIWGKDIF